MADTDLTRLPLDADGKPMQALFPARQQRIEMTAISKTHAAAFGTGVTVVEITPLVDCHILFGGSGVSADTDDIFLNAGVVYTYSTKNNDWLAAVKKQGGSDGNLYITELE